MENGYKNRELLDFTHYKEVAKQVIVVLMVHGNLSSLEPSMEARQLFSPFTYSSR